MTMKTKTFALLAITTALTACGGGGDEGEFIISNGVLTDVELPSVAERDGLPVEVADLINEFETLNETSTATDPGSFPTGAAKDATFSGTYGFGVEDDDGNETAILTGNLNLTVDYDATSIDGDVSNFDAYDGDGNPLPVTNTLTVTAGNAGPTITGGVAGTLLVAGENYDVSASFDGSYTGADGNGMIGTTQGTVTNPDASVDDLDGLWFADRN